VNKSIYDGHYALYRELFLLGCAFLKYASQIQLQNSMEQRPCAKRSLGASGLAIRWWNSIWKRADACGMGCALENFLLCAAASGFATAVSHVEGALGAQSSVSPLQMVARVYGRVHAFFVNAELYR
jgi:hypothetical protein